MTCSAAAAAFTLLLATMVSQAISRPVLLVVFDGVNDAFVASKMPDLDANNPIGRHVARPSLLRSENPTKPFALLHTIATGVLPDVHGVIANTMFDGNGNKMSDTTEQFNFNGNLKPIWTEAVLKGKTTATMNWPGAHFEMYAKKPNICEEYIEGAPWDHRVSRIKNWFETGRVDLGMAYFEDTNSQESVNSYIEKVYTTIKDLYGELKDLDVDIVVMSSHGKKNIETDSVLKMDDYLSRCDCECEFIASGGVSFIRFQNRDKLENVYSYLLNVDLDNDFEADNGTKFQVFKRDDKKLTEWNLKDFTYLENTLFVAAIDEHAFYDRTTYNDLVTKRVHSVRENGYLKSNHDMNGIFLLIGQSFKDNLVADDTEIQLTEVYQLIKRLLGLNESASVEQKFENLSNEMKKLIKDETLREWGQL